MPRSKRKRPKLRLRTLALSAGLTFLAVGGWLAALLGRPASGWWALGAAVSLCVGVAVTGELSRLVEVVLEARRAAERVIEGERAVLMKPTTRRKSLDEADELATCFNRMVAAMRRNSTRISQREKGDPLTGLCTHQNFQERLEHEIRRAERYDRMLSLLMIDLDEFGEANQRYSYAVGDEVLREVAQAVGSSIRETDVAARYGGDELGVLLVETPLFGAVEVAGKIRAEVTRRVVRVPSENDGESRVEIGATVSIGVASYPQHSIRREGLVAAANAAMQMAKHSGGNRVCPFNRVPGSQEVSDPTQLGRFLRNADWSALEALVAAVDARDQITGGHSKNVRRYALALARAIGLSERDVEAVGRAALLHDVGKIGITDGVLVKAGKLTSEERAVMQSHPGAGEALVRKTLSLSGALPGILYHHERHDGRGYPSGMAGDDIPIQARIIAIADAYDAMVSRRHYREPRGRQNARRELELGSGRQWDPELVRAFLSLEVEGLLNDGETAEAAFATELPR